MKKIFMSRENYRLFRALELPLDTQRSVLDACVDGVEVHASDYCPTWGDPGPNPPWWRRWFLREKRKPPERVFFAVEMP